MKKVALVIFYVLSIVVAAELSARATIKNQMSNFGRQLDQSQGVLAYNHLKRYRELESDLTKGCSSVALEKVRISAANESMLLSSFLRNHPGGSLEKYVSVRAPNLVEQLMTYQSPYGNTWTEPKCE